MINIVSIEFSATWRSIDMNQIHCWTLSIVSFFFQCYLSPDSFWRHDGKFWVISEDLKWLGSKYNNRCWKISLIMIVDFLKKLFIRTWTNWAYFLKGPFWLVCRELFKWTSFQKNLVFFEDALPGQWKKAIS